MKQLLSYSRSSAMDFWRAPVALGWFTIALCILLALTKSVHFSYHSSSGIIGWIAYHKYPKQQELFWFLAATFGVPAVMIMGLALWAIGSAGLANLTRRSPVGMLKVLAIGHLPFLMAWPRIARLRVDSWKMLPPAVGIGLLVVAVWSLDVLFFKRLLADEEISERAPGAHNDAAPRGAVWSSTAWRVLRPIIIFIAVPIFLYLV